jgi:HEPN domain-containing protein
LDEVNDALKRGEYFWVDIAREGIAIYQLRNHELTAPAPISLADALATAQRYYDARSRDVEIWIETAVEQSRKSEVSPRYGCHAAFNLHQAAESAYACFLLVEKLHFPRSHNLKFLRSLAESIDARLIAAWPLETKVDRRRFELLKRAYVEARYSAHYEISPYDLEAITNSVLRLRDIVEDVSRQRIEQLRTLVDLEKS